MIENYATINLAFVYVVAKLNIYIYAMRWGNWDGYEMVL